MPMRDKVFVCLTVIALACCTATSLSSVDGGVGYLSAAVLPAIPRVRHFHEESEQTLCKQGRRS